MGQQQVSAPGVRLLRLSTLSSKKLFVEHARRCSVVFGSAESLASLSGCPRHALQVHGPATGVPQSNSLGSQGSQWAVPLCSVSATISFPGTRRKGVAVPPSLPSWTVSLVKRGTRA